jgi:hypothetical protein
MKRQLLLQPQQQRRLQLQLRSLHPRGRVSGLAVQLMHPFVPGWYACTAAMIWSVHSSD